MAWSGCKWESKTCWIQLLTSYWFNFSVLAYFKKFRYRWPQGALPFKPIRDVPFSGYHFSAWIPERGMKIDQKFRNGLWLFVQEQKAIVFLLFCNLKVPKQGIKIQIFFLNGLWRLLKNAHLLVKLHSSALSTPSRWPGKDEQKYQLIFLLVFCGISTCLGRIWQ